MRVIAKRTLRDFWRRRPDAEGPLLEWHKQVSKARWKTPAEVKQQYGSASIIRNNRVVFNIKGNTYRLVVHIDYIHSVVYVCFVGTHAEYDAVDAETVRHV